MRVRVTFKVRNRGAVVPFHHQHLIAQVLRGLIVNSGEDQYNSFTHYNFSGLKGQTRVSRSGLHYTSSRVTVVLSSTYRDFLDFLISRIFDQEKMFTLMTPINKIFRLQYHDFENLVLVVRNS